MSEGDHARKDISDARSSLGMEEFISPIAEPLLHGKLLDRALRLLKESVTYEQSMKQKNKPARGLARQLKRGVAEVTKAIRKGQTGVVFLASDVYPIDIIAHFPIYCESKNILYCFVGNKRTLGSACSTKRPASVVMLNTPEKSMSYSHLYEKFHSGLKKEHPYF